MINLISNSTYVEPKYKLQLEIALQPDDSRAFSRFPPRVSLVEDERSYIHCKISKLGDLDLDKAYKELCDDGGKLKEEHKHLEVKGLTNALHFLKVFKIEWIKIVLSRVHNNALWLNKPKALKKDVIHSVTGYPTTDKPQAHKHPSIVEVERLTEAKSDKRELK